MANNKIVERDGSGEIFKTHGKWGIAMAIIAAVCLIFNLIIFVFAVPLFYDCSMVSVNVADKLSEKVYAVKTVNFYGNGENKKTYLEAFNEAGDDLGKELENYDKVFSEFADALEAYESNDDEAQNGDLEESVVKAANKLKGVFDECVKKSKILEGWVKVSAATLKDAEDYLKEENLKKIFTQTDDSDYMKSEYYKVKNYVLGKVIKDIGKQSLENLAKSVKDYSEEIAKFSAVAPGFKYENYSDIKELTRQNLFSGYSDKMINYKNLYGKLIDNMEDVALTAYGNVNSGSAGMCYGSIIKFLTWFTVVLDIVVLCIELSYGAFMLAQRLKTLKNQSSEN